MEAKFIEKYNMLSNMQPNDVAISEDRKNVFICGHFYDKEKKVNNKVILNLNNLWDQYSDAWDMKQPIRILKQGDKFTITI